jgi:hypothetical protein
MALKWSFLPSDAVEVTELGRRHGWERTVAPA